MRIVERLSGAEQVAFRELLIAWNPFIYIVAICIVLYLTLPIFRFLNDPDKSYDLGEAHLADLRKRTLGMPLILFLVSCLGWGGSAILFPLGIYLKAHTLTLETLVHFEISFVLSWLVATTYSYINTQYFALRVVYPRLWVGCRDVQQTAARELQGIDNRVRQSQMLATVVPLIGAALMVAVGPDSLDSRNYQIYRILLSAFILMGGAGVLYAMSSGKALLATLLHLTRRA